MDQVTFKAVRYDEEGDYIGHVEHTFQCEGHLSEMLFNFKAFLQGMTFGYVKEVYAVKNDGEEVGEE